MYITVAASKITLIVAQIYTTAVSILYCIIAINTQYIILTYTIAERKKIIGSHQQYSKNVARFWTHMTSQIQTKDYAEEIKFTDRWLNHKN